jgi:hypothetical protein
MVAPGDRGDNLNVFFYVVAQSYQRMLRTFQDGSDSKPYIDCLLEMEPSQARTIELPFPNPQPIGSPLGKRDGAFIKLLAQPITEHFLHLAEIIPSLIQLARQYCDVPGTPFYTQDTCEEFQSLLCHLLRRFKTALHALHAFRDIPPALRDSDGFESAIYALTICGLTLHSFVHSSFLEENLRRIRAPNP